MSELSQWELFDVMPFDFDVLLLNVNASVAA